MRVFARVFALNWPQTFNKLQNNYVLSKNPLSINVSSFKLLKRPHSFK